MSLVPSIIAGAVSGGIFGLVGQLAGTRVEMRGLADARDSHSRVRRTELAEQALAAAGTVAASLKSAAMMIAVREFQPEAFVQLDHAQKLRWQMQDALLSLKLYLGPDADTVKCGDTFIEAAAGTFADLSMVRRHVQSGEDGWPEWVTAPQLAALERAKELPGLVDAFALAAATDLGNAAKR